MLEGLTEEEYASLVMSVGTHVSKRRLFPIQVSELIQKAMEHNTLQEIAESLNLRTTGDLQRFVSLLGLPRELQKLVSWGNRKGNLSYSVAAEIAKLSGAHEKRELAKAALEFRLSKSDVMAVVQRHKRGNIPVKDAVDEIQKLHPVVERQFLLVADVSGVNLDDDVSRRRIREQLSKIIGGENILSVSVTEGRVAALVNEKAVNKEALATNLAPKALDNFFRTLLFRD